MKTPEDEAFEEIEKAQGWRKRKIQKVIEDDDDDIQDYKKPWLGLTDDEYQEILVKHNEGGLILFYHLIEAKLKSKNI